MKGLPLSGSVATEEGYWWGMHDVWVLQERYPGAASAAPTVEFVTAKFEHGGPGRVHVDSERGHEREKGEGVGG